MTNYYHILGISENASLEEIRVAFKKLAVKYHPDKHPDKPGMEERFKEINHAYQVLSDHYEKTRYDAKLAYHRFSKPGPTFHVRPRQPRPYRSAHPGFQKIDYKKNAIATAYAFGMTFAIALVVMVGVWIKQSYDQWQLEKLLTERRYIYNEARMLFENQDYATAFELMSSLNLFRAEERDIRRFKENMVNELIRKGQTSFEDNEFDEAIYLFELVQKFEFNKPLFGIKVQLVEAYKRIDQPLKSIAILEDLLLKEYRIISSLVEIAEIHRDHLNDLESAKDYYNTAHKMAIKQYKNFYGEGYPLVINEKYVPKEHYRLYSGLADIHYRLKDANMAIRAANWNKYVWPDSVDAYITSGYAQLLLNETRKACNEFRMGKQKGWKQVPPVQCK